MALPETIADRTASARDAQSGLVVGLFCYLLWGFLPLLFKLLEPVGAVGIVANRSVWSLLFVGAILLVMGRMGEVRAALADRQTIKALSLTTLLLATNWLAYVWAVESGQLLEASFGYFINPLVNVAIGMLLLGERQNRMQAIAICIAVIAITIQTIGLGRVPYIALFLALSFGFYGFFRKTAKVSSAGGLFVETLLLIPFALAYLGYSAWRGELIPFYTDPWSLTLLLLTGPATAVPLLMFTFAVQRLRLTTIGMLQYISPSIQFLLAVYVFHEGIDGVRLLSFGLIWLSLAIYSADSFRRRGKASAG